jgi:hypothetical protein
MGAFLLADVKIVVFQVGGGDGGGSVVADWSANCCKCGCEIDVGDFVEKYSVCID